jgi:CDP-glucose 4,6-dehydratase
VGIGQGALEGVGILNADFWKNRSVFLTGHTGFKGAWLALWLSSMGAKVRAFALDPPTSPSLFELARVGEWVESVKGDVRDLNALKENLRVARPDVVLHLAAQPLVRLSYRDPVETFSTNVMGTVNLLEAVRMTGSVRAVVVVTSDKCYENREWLWGYRESEAMGGYDPYSSSKGCAELVTAAYRRSYFSGPENSSVSTAVASARAGNVIGGGDWAEDRLVPDLMRALSSDKRVQIRNPLATRPWQHVLEPLAGYLTLAERLYSDGEKVAEAWNFGPDEQNMRTVEDLCEGVVRRWGKGAGWEHDRSENPHEAQALKLDSSKARIRLGWRPRLNFEQTLDWTVDWYSRLAAGESARNLVLQDIERYATVR